MPQSFSVSQQANWSWSSRWRSMRVVLHLGVLAASCHGWDGKWQPTGIWVLARIRGARRGEFYPAWSHTGWTGHPLAFVFTHLSDLQDLPTPPGFSSTLPFILFYFFSDTLLLADHFSGEPFCWAFSSFCNLRSLVFTIPLVCACSLSLLVVLSHLFNNWICHSYWIQALSKFATSSY